MAKHIVQAGETLGVIAKQYLGKSSLYTVIAKASGITNPDRVAIGTELTIPDDLLVAPEPAANAPAPKSIPTSSAAPTAVFGAELSAEQLQQILHTSDNTLVDKYLDPLNLCFERYQINSPLRIAHFLAQVCHESNNFKALSENLNYSAKALQGVFGKYFDQQSADEYARKPELIANRVYANRMGNGSESSGDGWAYRGRGLMQLTGKDNYRQFSESYGVDVVTEPKLVAENAELCVAVAGWYWDSRKLNLLADADDIKVITKKINGGYHGLDDRVVKLARAKGVLNQ
ncbi:MAG: putative chitinase [Phenylobacterium sp.]|jgi:putative chitinase